MDLAIIGAGPGGYVAAIRAAQLGMRVTCVEKAKALGGTCLRIGCIPSKALLDSSELYWQARTRFKTHGIVTGDVGLDLPAMLGRKDRVVSTLTGGVAALFKKHGVQHVEGSARITAPGQVEVAGGSLEADRILIATGSEPAPLSGFDVDGGRIITSEHALALPAVPKRLLVIGAGAVGLELGSVWARLGAEVTVVEMLDRIVPGMDAELARALQRALERQGLTFRLSSSAEDLDASAFDRILVAVGRRPYVEGLGLDALGIAIDERGRIRVDERYETSVPGIHAIGDVIAGPMLAHKASEEGIACVEQMAGQAGHVNYEAIPNVVYTSPELASVGRTEDDAGADVRVGRFPFMASGRARAMDEREGMVKVVADARTDRILGVHVLGPRASELIAEATLAIEFGASAEDVARTSHAHPTLAETLREAALAVADRAIHI